jgi:hypothetical protein
VTQSPSVLSVRVAFFFSARLLILISISESQYRNRLELKLRQDRVLGSGATGAEGELLFFTSGTMLRAVLDAESIGRFSAEYAFPSGQTYMISYIANRTGHADIIKSTMTQSILYAPISQARMASRLHRMPHKTWHRTH